MRVLVINGFPATDDNDRYLTDVACRALETNGHQVDRLDLAAEGFVMAMSPEERAAYHEDRPLITVETKRSAQLVKQADAMLFCYPTITHTVPALLKGWCERVLVPGVAFVFDDRNKVAPGMTNIRRIGVVTVTPHRRLARWRHRDLGYRTIMRTLRLSCHPRCRRTMTRLERGLPEPKATAAVTRTIGRW